MVVKLGLVNALMTFYHGQSTFQISKDKAILRYSENNRQAV